MVFAKGKATSQLVRLFARQNRVYAAATPLHLAPVLYLIAIALRATKCRAFHAKFASVLGA